MNSETDSDRGCGGCKKVCEKSYEIVVFGRKEQAERRAKLGTLLPTEVPLKQMVDEEQKARELGCRVQIQRRSTSSRDYTN
jgi:hypothetical protein